MWLVIMGSKAEHLTDFAERRQGKKKKKNNEIDLQACFYILLFRMCYLIKKEEEQEISKED